MQTDASGEVLRRYQCDDRRQTFGSDSVEVGENAGKKARPLKTEPAFSASPHRRAGTAPRLCAAPSGALPRPPSDGK